MTAIIWITIVVWVSAYLAVGRNYAKRRLPELWERARDDWLSDGAQRSQVKEHVVGIMLCWPVVMSLRVASRHLDQMITDGDPMEMERRLDEQARELRERKRHVREMEKEMGWE